MIPSLMSQSYTSLEALGLEHQSSLLLPSSQDLLSPTGSTLRSSGRRSRHMRVRSHNSRTDLLRTSYIDEKELGYCVEVVICYKDCQQVSKLHAEYDLTTKELEALIIEKRKMDAYKWKLIGVTTEKQNIFFNGSERVGSFFDMRLSMLGKLGQLQRFKLLSVADYEALSKNTFSERRRMARETLIRKRSCPQLIPDFTEGFLQKRGGKNKAWKTRFFVLCGSELNYYSTEDKFLNDPDTLRFKKGAIKMRDALEIRFPPEENGLVCDGTIGERYKSNIGGPHEGEFEIVTSNRIYQFRVLPDQDNDHRDLVRWVRALKFSMDFHSKDNTPVIFQCLNEIIESTSKEQSSIEDSLIDQLRDVSTAFECKDSRNLFLAYISNDLPEISELLAGYYEYIVGKKYKGKRSSWAEKLIKQFVKKKRYRFVDELTVNMKNKCSSLSNTVEGIHRIAFEILTSPQVETLFQEFLESVRFKTYIWHHVSKTHSNGRHEPGSKWPTDLEKRLSSIREARKLLLIENLTDQSSFGERMWTMSSSGKPGNLEVDQWLERTVGKSFERSIDF